MTCRRREREGEAGPDKAHGRPCFDPLDRQIYSLSVLSALKNNMLPGR